MGFEDIKVRLGLAEKSAGRAPGSTKLIAVSKLQPDERVAEVLAQGHCCFGENRVQEAARKWPAFRTQYTNIELHLIGPLQTNKVKQALEIFDVIQTVDREKLAKKLAEEIARKDGVAPGLFIQINTGEEPQKAGVLPGESKDFIALCREDLKLPIMGLMAIPPADEPAAPHFALLKKIADRHGLKELSMGMSADFETAISLGASYIRVGSALFGERYP